MDILCHSASHLLSQTLTLGTHYPMQHRFFSFADLGLMLFECIENGEDARNLAATCRTQSARSYTRLPKHVNLSEDLPKTTSNPDVRAVRLHR